MKITYLHQYFQTPDAAGGTRSFETARELVEKGHEVNVITANRFAEKSGWTWKTEQVAGINIHWIDMPFRNYQGYSTRVVGFIKFAILSLSKALSIKTDLIFATSTPLTIAIPGVLAKKIKRKPMVFEVRDLWPELPIAIGALKAPPAIWVAKRLEKWTYKNSSAIIGLSPGMCEGIVAAGVSEDKVYNIPNLSDIDRFSVEPEQGLAYLEERGWPADTQLILYAGTFGVINGASYLVELAAELVKLNSKVKVLLIGEGFEKNHIENRAKELGLLDDKVFVSSPVPKSEIPKVYSAATIVTSLFIPLKEMQSNSANKFFDGLASGKPVMINYGGWQANYLKDYDAGIVLQNEDYCEAAQRVNRLLHNKERLTEIAENATKLAQKEFSRDKLVEKFIGVLEKSNN